MLKEFAFGRAKSSLRELASMKKGGILNGRLSFPESSHSLYNLITTEVVIADTIKIVVLEKHG